MSDAWQSEYQQLVDDCEAREDRLSDWERGFIDSISQQIGRNKMLTPKQIDTLDSIWERVTAKW